MKKRYENPICDLFVVEEQLMGNANSNWSIIGENPEGVGTGEGGFIDNGPGGGGSEVNPDDLGAKGTSPIFDF